MPIVDVYSSRDANPPDIWIYDRIPEILRVQVLNIARKALGTTSEYSQYNSLKIYDFIASSVAHEHGLDALASTKVSAVTNVHNCIRNGSDFALWRDCVEITFRAIQVARGNWNSHEQNMGEVEIAAADAISELNERFRRAGFGYQFHDGKLYRIDSELMHREATVPALRLLSDPRFKGANEEFRAAHDHFKAGQNKDCAVDALNALESAMKTICDIRGWEYQKGARATDLIKVLRKNDLFPEFADASFEQLLATLKSGLPAVRNEAGAHGQGAVAKEIPDYVASYALNLAGSKIRLLVEAFIALEAKADK